MWCGKWAKILAKESRQTFTARDSVAVLVRPSPGLSAHSGFYRTVPFMRIIHKRLQKLQEKLGGFFFFFFWTAQLLSSPFCKSVTVCYHTVYMWRQHCGKTCYWSGFKLSEEFSLRLMKEVKYLLCIISFYFPTSFILLTEMCIYI